MAEKNYGTIKIPEPAYDHHNERRQDMGVTWEAYINGNAPEVPNHAELDTEALVSDLVDEIGATVGGPRVDDSEIAREVARQIDYAQLANEVGEEVERRLR